MKFIYPKNYNFKSKLFGIIDYSTAIFLTLWGTFLFCLLNLLIPITYIKIFLFIALFFPILIFGFVGFNHENILYVFMYIFKFIKNNKIYLYK